jgi:hypothetical protein
VGDLVPNGYIDIADVQFVAGRWNLAMGASGYDSRADLNANNRIDIADVQDEASRFGTDCNDWPLARAQAGDPRVRLSALPINVAAGDVFTVAVSAGSVRNLGAFEFALALDPAHAVVEAVTVAGWPASSGRAFYALQASDSTGNLRFAAYSLGGQPGGASGQGQLAVVRLRALATGAPAVTLANAQLVDVHGQPAARAGGVFLPVVSTSE